MGFFFEMFFLISFKYFCWVVEFEEGQSKKLTNKSKVPRERVFEILTTTDELRSAALVCAPCLL